MGSTSLPAINAKQFYVTVSRGSEDVAIYVDDKAKVRRSIERSGHQMSATELIGETAKSAFERSAAPEKENALTAAFHHGRRAAYSFRDRVTQWWRRASEATREKEPLGRHRNEPAQGMGIPNSMERSRT